MGIKKKGKDYYLDYSTYEINDKGERERRRHQEKIGPSLALAEAILRKKLLEITEEKYFPQAPGKPHVMLRDFIERYMAESRATKSRKMQLVDHNSTRHLAERLGDLALHTITPGDVQQYVQARLEEVSPSSVNREISCLKTMLNRAVTWELLEVNQLARVKKLPEPPERIRYLSKDEVKRLISHCLTHMVPIVWCALFTGMRKMEILGLTWADVDLEKRFIFVRYPTQSKKQGRLVPVGKRLFKILTELPRKNEFVFGGLKDIKKGFASACRKAKIKDFRFHDLRHTAASWMAMEGVPLPAMQKILGHAKIEMTMRYVQLSDELLRKAIDTLENTLAPDMDF